MIGKKEESVNKYESNRYAHRVFLGVMLFVAMGVNGVWMGELRAGNDTEVGFSVAAIVGASVIMSAQSWTKNEMSSGKKQNDQSSSSSPVKEKNSEVDKQMEFYLALSHSADEFMASGGEFVSPLLVDAMERAANNLREKKGIVPSDIELAYEIYRSSEMLLRALGEVS